MTIQKILVPTDFSHYANYASGVALQIAQETKAQIEFYHQTHILAGWDHLEENSQLYYQQNFVREEEAIIKLNNFKENKVFQDVDIMTSHGHGNLIATIMDKVEDEEIDLIVMGTQGRTDHEMGLGSNTLKVLRLVNCPVLTVKKRPKDFKIENILFASSFKKENLDVLQKLLDLTSQWNAKIHLINIDINHRFEETPELFKKSIKSFINLCGDHLGEIHSVPEENIEEGINKISKELEADIVAIGTHLREYKHHMYSSFITEAIVQTVEIPVLTLQIKEE